MINNASDIPKTLDMVLLTPTLDGGVGRFISLIARGMNKRGISVSTWTISGGSYENETKKWSQVEYLPGNHARGIIRPLIKMLQKNKPQVILSLSFHINCVVVIASILSRIQTRLFISEHTSVDAAFITLPTWKRLIVKYCVRLFYRRADGWIAVSKGVAQQMASYAKIKLESVNVIYNPVITPEMINMSKESVEHPFFKTNSPVILAVGRLSVEKDYPTLLKAISQIKTSPPVRLIILGDGPERENIIKHIETLKISEFVSLLGNVSNPYPYFTNSNVYVLSSIREGLPTTLIEAMTLGIPIVSTDIPSGPREILNNSTYGKLVPPKDSVALAKAITDTLGSKKPNIPTAALDKYQSKYAIDTYLNILFPGRP